MNEWEKVYEENAQNYLVSTWRMKMPGGWIVKDTWHIYGEINEVTSQSMCFVPDIHHTWKIE